MSGMMRGVKTRGEIGACDWCGAACSQTKKHFQNELRAAGRVCTRLPGQNFFSITHTVRVRRRKSFFGLTRQEFLPLFLFFR